MDDKLSKPYKTIVIDSMTSFAEAITEKIQDETLDCCVKNCDKKVCTWSNTNCCYDHAVEILGLDEMNRRYARTHGEAWNEPMSYREFCTENLIGKQVVMKVNKR